jgi:hypothetical protein
MAANLVSQAVFKKTGASITRYDDGKVGVDFGDSLGGKTYRDESDYRKGFSVWLAMRRSRLIQHLAEINDMERKLASGKL